MKKVKEKKIASRGETIPVADRLHSGAIHLLRRVRKQDEASGIGPAQLSALSVLVFSGSKTFGELAAAEQVKPPTISRIVAGLRRTRLIEITADPHDARRKHVRATATGVRLLQEGRQRRIQYLADHLATLTTTELSQLAAGVDVLDKLLRDWR